MAGMGVPAEVPGDLRSLADQVRESGARLIERATGTVNWNGDAAWRFRERMRRRLGEFEECADLLAVAADRAEILIVELEHPR